MASAIAISLALILLTALIHYEGLRLASNAWRASAAPLGRTRVLIVILWIFLIHIVEICVYGVGLWFSDVVVDIGTFAGAREVGSFDYFYFSAEAFSTLGLGDIYPVGPLRLVASIEPITGLLLIGWSVSFTFIIMQRFWFLDEGTDDAPRS